MSADYDVVIVGAGMVGSALACLLAEDGFTVAVLDRVLPPPPDPECAPGLRVSAISPGSVRLLEATGAWRAIADAGVSAYSRMHVWSSAGGSQGQISFDCAELALPALGYIAENAAIQRALLARLRRFAGAELFVPAELAAIEPGETHLRLVLGEGRVLRTRLLIGADGANSGVRKLAGLTSRGRDYDQHAVVAHVACERAHEQTARQRFMPDGPLALLPMAPGRCSIVWSTTPQQAQMLCAAPVAQFETALSEASEQVLGALTLASDRASFPLRMQYAPDYVRPRIALVGDAAHSVHPLAGQGVNLGFADAAALAEVLGASRAAAADPGDMLALRRYERWRKTENLATMAALDGIGKLFGSRDPLLGRVREIGLNLTDRLAPVKYTLARRAMGLAGDLPRLLRDRSQRES